MSGHFGQVPVGRETAKLGRSSRDGTFGISLTFACCVGQYWGHPRLRFIRMESPLWFRKLIWPRWGGVGGFQAALVEDPFEEWLESCGCVIPDGEYAIGLNNIIATRAPTSCRGCQAVPGNVPLRLRFRQPIGRARKSASC